MELYQIINIVLTLLYVGAVLYGVKILREQVTTLKEQVNSQKEILNNSETYSKIFDLNKIKDYARLTEKNAKLKAKQSLQKLNTEIDAKQKQVDILAQREQELMQETMRLEQEKVSAEGGLMMMHNYRERDAAAWGEFGLNRLDYPYFLGNAFAFVAGYIQLNKLSEDQTNEFLSRHFGMSVGPVLNYIVSDKWTLEKEKYWLKDADPTNEHVSDLLVPKWHKKTLHNKLCTHFYIHS